MPHRQKCRLERFSCGVIHATPGALDALVRNQQNVVPLLARHKQADRKAVREAGRSRNKSSGEPENGRRSAFTLHDGTHLWIVTDPGLAITLLLLVGEE